MSRSTAVSIVVFSLHVGCGGTAGTTPAPVDAPSGTGVRFTKKRPGVGTVSLTREHNETRLEIDVTVDGAVHHSTNDTVETIERRAEILAVGDDGAETRIKVAYRTYQKEETGKGLVSSPVEGKTYVLEGHGGKLPSVTDDAGNPPPEAEAQVVANDFKHLGRPDPFWRGLPERPLAAGDSMDDMAKVVLADDAADGLEQVQVRFEGGHDVGGTPAGVFAVQLTGKLDGATRVTMKGRVALLLASGWEAESEAEGPLDFSQQGTKNGKSFTVAAHGTLHIHKGTSYETK
jgi:hypothetical protein